MTRATVPPTRRLIAALAATSLAFVLAACGGGDEAGTATDSGAGESTGNSEELSGSVRVDGSSTVFPLTEAAAELFQEEQPDVRVTVGTSGTGGGFEKFCAGETDISNASRPIGEDEIAACEENDISFAEFTVANDGLTVVVNKENDWIDCITVEQLNKIWEPGSTVNNWNQVDPSFPDEELKLFGAGTDSGTFDYFTDVINGEEGASRTDYAPTEDDNVTVQGVSNSPGGMGYFGLSYFEENADQLKALEVDGGDGCVAPSTETVQDGSYQPLGRPLFIYPSAKALENPAAEAFVEFYVANSAEIAEEALFVPLNDEQQAELEQALEALRSGEAVSRSSEEESSEEADAEPSEEPSEEASDEPSEEPSEEASADSTSGS